MSWRPSRVKVERAVGGLSIREALESGAEAWAYCPSCRCWRPIMLRALPERMKAFTLQTVANRARCYVPACRARTSVVRVSLEGSHVCSLRAFHTRD